MKAKDVLTILLLPFILTIGAIGVLFYTTGKILEHAGFRGDYEKNCSSGD